LVEQHDRLHALLEAHRVLKPRGVLFAAAIFRFASMLDGLSRGFFRDVEFRKIVERDLTCGVHGNPTNEPAYFTTAYFHRSDELATEVADARILAIEGPVWSAALFREAWNDAAQRESLMNFLSLVE